MNRLLILAMFVLFLAAARDALADERQVRQVKWQAQTDKDGVVEIVAPPEGNSVNILKLEKPGVTQPTYSIQGEISYSDVPKAGYLEMWSYFDNGGFYFSRTLATDGPMRAIHGTSNWRSFALPFFANEDMIPYRIEVNVVLPAGGTVRLRPARLMEFATPPQGWWTPRQGNVFGGIFGAIIGICGTMIGLLAGRGKARNFVLSLMITLIIVGAMMFLLGTVALLSGQPYAVWFALLLGGGLSAGICASLLPGARRRYEQAELRRIEALDALG